MPLNTRLHIDTCAAPPLIRPVRRTAKRKSVISPTVAHRRGSPAGRNSCHYARALRTSEAIYSGRITNPSR